jgi:ABC-three component (ABC-3C) system Middle Component 5
MIQLSYQAAFDPFHAMYRDLRILNAIGPLKPLFVDQVRILDFYLLFPFKISAIRLIPQHRRFRGLADDYENAQPYGSQPDNAQIFARMKPIQIAALESLAEKQIIDAAELKNGNVVRTEISLPPALVARVSSANVREPKLMEAISALGSEYPLLGQNGLKDRTGLLEYRYDAV